MAEWEYRAVHLPVGVTARHAREVLGIHAEFGGWELDRHAVWPDGRRKVTLRRRLRAEGSAA
ncbi:MAG TPA: DUF5703 family protein [Mycobacteriales bacterium]|nr:DUF5703 family protein [Mycobacteriales bacterium]